MKIKYVLFLIFCLFLINVSVNASDSKLFKVIKIIDGDTLYVDFNNNNVIEKNERVRLNGIDAFEIRLSERFEFQAKKYDFSNKEVLFLGYLGRKFAQKELLNKKVYIKYSAKDKVDIYNRPLVSIKYDCKDGICKNYCEEILKAGYATVYLKSNLANLLLRFEDMDKIKINANKKYKFSFIKYLE